MSQSDWLKFLFFLVHLPLAGLLGPARPVHGTLISGATFEDVFKDADFVGLVKIVPCNHPSHRADVPKVRVIEAFKATAPDTEFHLAYLRENREAGSEWVVLLRGTGEAGPAEVVEPGWISEAVSPKWALTYWIMFNGGGAWPIKPGTHYGLPTTVEVARTGWVGIPPELAATSWPDCDAGLSPAAFITRESLVAYLKQPTFTAPTATSFDVPSWRTPCPQSNPIPLVVERVEPEHPARARAAGVEARVVLQVLVRRDGAVQADDSNCLQSRVIRSGPPSEAEDRKWRDEFCKSSLDAVKQWKYKPATLKGQPTGTPVTVVFEFRLP